MNRVVKFVGFLVVLGTLAACGPSGHDLKGGTAPAWANRAPGGWMCEFQGKSGMCSMGMVTGIRGDASMRRTAAAERARAGMQRLFDTYAASLFKSYQAATTDFRDANEEQHVEQALKTFSAGHLSGVEIADYWENDGMDAFALAFLSIDQFKSAMDKMGDLSTKAREVIKGNASKAHADLKAEESKREVQ